MGLQKRILDVCELLTAIIWQKEKKTSRSYAAWLIDRVQEIIKEGGEFGCKESVIIHSFKLDKADLIDYTLRELYKRGVLRKEVRYFITK